MIWAELPGTHKQLYVESWSNSARALLIRGHASGGPFAESHTTNSDRSRATSTFELHGMPQSIQISPETAGVRRGECYVRTSLLLDGEPVKRLIAAYLTDGKTLSWPPGVHEGFTEGPGQDRVVAGTDPAANTEISETVPTNAVWRVRAVYFPLVTDANVANRLVQLIMDDGTNIFFAGDALVQQAASLTHKYNFGIGLTTMSTLGNGTAHYLSLPDHRLKGGYRIRTSTGGIQATDNYGQPFLLVEEWLEE